MNKLYLCYILGSDVIMSEYKRLATGGVVNNLNSNLVRNCRIPLPPLDIQRKIVDEIEKHQERIRHYNEQIIAEKKRIENELSSVWGV